MAKDDVDRIDLVDGGEHARRGVVADAHVGAGLARDRADAARHRRADLGVAELGQRCSGASPRRTRAAPRAAFSVGRRWCRACTTVPAPLVSRSSARAESRLACSTCAWSLRICASIWASCAFERARIELEQQVAFLDQRALLDIDLHDLAVEARLDLDRGDRLHRADRLDDDRHRLLGDRGDDDGHGAARIGAAAAALRLRRWRPDWRAPFSAALAAAPKPSLWATSSR